jgi:hypothetical protein
VFLRVLEYYSGILFLTTNRIGDFDEAFASRIHVSLEYPPLDRPSTEKILALNIRLIKDRFRKNGRTIEIDEMGIAFSALDYWQTHEKARLNGRQIRNACQTALALAEFEAQGGSHEAVLAPNATVSLQSRHFDIVSKAYLDFNKYLKDIYGTSAEEHAGELGLRAREKVVRKAKAPPPQSTSGGPHAGGFPGAHLYQPHPQMHVSSHQGYAPPPPPPGQYVYQTLPPAQQSYSAQMSGQQNFSAPGQNLNSPLPSHPNPAYRSDAQQQPAKSEHIIRQPDTDTHVGHDSQHHPQSYSLGPGQQYFQSNQGDSHN